MQNIAFVDGQNLNLGTREHGWKVDYEKLRVYLKEGYCIDTAYYFPGYRNERYEKLYTKLQEFGFTLVFKKHNDFQVSKKKGNIDVLMAFTIMRTLSEHGETFDKILLITGDGDFYELVNYLIEKERFAKILFPAKENASSLYKSLGSEHYDFLNNPGIKPLFEYTQ